MFIDNHARLLNDPRLTGIARDIIGPNAEISAR